MQQQENSTSRRREKPDEGGENITNALITQPKRLLQTTLPLNFARTGDAARTQPAPINLAVVRQKCGRLIQAKDWCFTLWMNEKPVKPPQVDYMIFQQEQAPNAASNNPTAGKHWQGYMECKDRLSCRQVLKLMGWGIGAHIAPRRGSQSQAIEYCRKGESAIPGTLEEHGEKHPADAPGSWDAMIKDVKSGSNFKEVIENHTRLGIQFHSGVQKAISVLQTAPRWRNVTVFILWGPTGVGKTRRVFDTEGDNLYKKLRQKQGAQVFFNGYEEQEAILFDEFKGEYSLQDMLEWTDGYPLRIEIKGDTRIALWSRVYICSNIDPQLWYPGARQEEIEALWRRIPEKNIYHITQNLYPPEEPSVAYEIEEEDQEILPTPASEETEEKREESVNTWLANIVGLRDKLEQNEELVL